MISKLPDFLPGRLVLEPGTSRDYFALEQFHYLPKRPATWAGVWRIRYIPSVGSDRTIAVGVMSYPTARSKPRERVFKLSGQSLGQMLRFANQHIRTISRVVVHPQFRALGLSTILVQCLIENCPTRYVEATAVMGRIHPFFERAGMKRVDPEDSEGAIYFIFDRGKEEELRKAA